VRLVVVPLADNCPRLASTAAAAAADMLALLPPGCKVGQLYFVRGCYSVFVDSSCVCSQTSTCDGLFSGGKVLHAQLRFG
jgi:hypothetical protein